MSDAKPNITLNDVLGFLYKASREDRQAVSRTLNVLRDDDILTAKMEFTVGDKVKFTIPKKRGYPPRTLRGTIFRKNQKTIEVKVNDGFSTKTWKVTASLLQKDED